MKTPPDHVRTLEALRDYVLRVLCEKENLLIEQFRLQEFPLMRGESRCGMQFLLRGPRQVQLAAVWASEVNHLYFYDARGERFAKQVLPHPVEAV